MDLSLPHTPFKPALLPLVIGFTGHREFRTEDIQFIEQKVREVFSGLREKYPSTPLILLTSLAEGADRIAAHIAIEAGIALIAPLPLRPAVYQTDFLTDHSTEELDN